MDVDVDVDVYGTYKCYMVAYQNELVELQFRWEQHIAVVTFKGLSKQNWVLPCNAKVITSKCYIFA